MRVPASTRQYRLRPYRLGAAAFAAVTLLSMLLVSAPGRSPAGPLTEPSVPLAPAVPPAAAAQPAPGAPAGPAHDAAAAAKAGRAAEAADAANADRGQRVGPIEPSFAPVAGPAAGGRSPRVARLRLGSFERPAAGVQASVGVPRGIPLAPETTGLRGTSAARTIAVRKPETATFSAVGVTWLGGTRATLSIAVRAHVPRKGWGPWRTAGSATQDRDNDAVPADRPQPGQARRDPAAADRREARPVWRAGADLVWLGAADGVEVHVTGARARDVDDIVVDLIDPLTVPEDATAAAAPGSAASTGRVGMPPIASRAAWGADERLMTWGPVYAGPVKAIAWHHTATDNTYAPADVPRILRAIYYHQAVGRGWGDIGYNVLVDRFGRLWEGRSGGLSKPVIGAHTGGFNTYTAGIAAIGDHRSTSVPAAVTESAARYAAWKLSLGPAVDPRGTVRLTGGGSTSRHPPNTTITAPRIFPHRLTNPTECPGARGMDVLAPMRERAFRLMGALADPTTVRARLATWRPSDARWRIRGAADPGPAGTAGDLPATADFDGDGSADVASWTPGTGQWQIARSAGGAVEQHTLGTIGDWPVPGDYDGDGRAGPAVWRAANGLWLMPGAPPVQWGAVGDIPVPADYNGDGRTDLAVWRPATGMWHILGVGTFRLGESYHIPVPADYDGDGDAEPASWSPVSHRWFVWGAQAVKFGQAGDVPVPAQYDGDGRADFAVWRPPATGGGEGTFLLNRLGSFAFGQTGDVPAALS